MENYNKDLEMDPTKQETGTDPLQEWREDKSAPSGVSKKDLEGNMPDEEEQDRVKANLPERDKFIPMDEIAPEQESFREELEGSEEMGDMESELEELFDGQGNQFLKYDFSGESEPSKSKETLAYTEEEFDLMEQCSKYKARTELSERLIQQRPLFLKRKDGTGIEVTDEQVLQQVQAYNDCKKNNKWLEYHVDDIKFMKRCAAWNYYYQKVLNTSKGTPKMVDGTPLSEEQITEVALEYNKFRTTEPEEFAKQKLEKGEWVKASFEWVPDFYKDKKQWASYVVEYEQTEKGQVRKETKYITSTKPALLSGESYYTLDGNFDDKSKNFSARFINIRYPTDRNLQIANEKEELKDQMVENES